MRFSIADQYGGGSDAGAWTPMGVPDAVQSDAGFNGFVKDPLKAHEKEMQFAGDSLSQYVNVLNAKETADAQIKAYEKAKSAAGGGGSGIGQIIGKVGGAALGSAIPGVGTALGSTIGSGLGGLFG